MNASTMAGPVFAAETAGETQVSRVQRGPVYAAEVAGEITAAS